MMNRFCRYIDKCFHFQQLLPLFRDARQKPHDRQCGRLRQCLHALVRWQPHQLEQPGKRPRRTAAAAARGVVGPRPPSIDTLGRVYSPWGTATALAADAGGGSTTASNATRRPGVDGDDLKIIAVDGHEFFASRKRCCEQCQQRTLKVQDEEVVEYYHQGVVAHLIEHQLAVPLDVELLRPAGRGRNGGQTVVRESLHQLWAFLRRGLWRCLYFDAPFINFCRTITSTPWWSSKASTGLLMLPPGVFAQQPACRLGSRGDAMFRPGRRRLHHLRRAEAAVAGGAYAGDGPPPRAGRRPVAGE